MLGMSPFHSAWSKWIDVMLHTDLTPKSRYEINVDSIWLKCRQALKLLGSAFGFKSGLADLLYAITDSLFISTQSIKIKLTLVNIWVGIPTLLFPA